MAKLMSIAGLGNVWCATYLVVVASQIVLLQGEVVIEYSTPTPIRKGDDVLVRCALKNFYDGPNATPRAQAEGKRCRIVWSRSYYTSSHGQLYQEVLSNTHMVTIYGTKDEMGRPALSTLTLSRVDSTADGHYKCSAVCPNHVESDSLTIKVESAGWYFWSSDSSTMVGSVITVAMIFIILLGAVFLAMKPYCCLKCSRRQATSSVSEDSESSFLESGVSDPPPRYSVVINTSQNSEGHSSIEDLTRQRRMSQPGTIDSVFFVPLDSAPPDYTHAIMDLAEKGVIFNPESLKPMPPSYEDASKYPLKT